MYSATLLFSALLVLLQNADCLSVGRLCNILAADECDPGLTCVAFGTLARCQSINRDPCELATCPSVWCGPNLQYTPEGECCPICPPEPTIHQPAGCPENGTSYSEGETWKRDDCTTCTCINGFTLCSAVSCLPLSCSNPVYLPDQCCPVCLEVSRECNIEGKIYQDGERWTPDITRPCQRAYCAEGQVLIYSFQCAAVECKNPVYFEDTCCPICPVEIPGPTPVPTPHKPAPGCTLDNGDTLSDGDSSCPAPNVTAVCNSGVLEYKAHCEPITCANPIRGQDPCDCPFCADDAQEFVVEGVLDMSLPVYARNAQRVEDMVHELVLDAGFHFDHLIASRCNSRICMDIHVLTPDEDATLDEVVQALRDELNSKGHEDLEIITIARRSARSVDDGESLSSSSSSSDRHSSLSTTTIIAVSASACAVVASVVGVALLAIFVRRKHTTGTKITV